MTSDPRTRRRLLDLRSGGGVVLLAILLSTGVFSWRVVEVLKARGRQAVGDGKNPATYGFDLSNATVPAGAIIASGLPKDGIHAIDAPSILTIGQVDAMKGRNKLLVSSDRVIGVEIDGRARAYPIRILNWHEVVNDTLGGVPVAVTYSPLCDAAVAFDRRMGIGDPGAAGADAGGPGADGPGAGVASTADPGAGSAEAGDAERRATTEILRFGVSGLLLNSNLLMYDARPGHTGESLWSQLGFGAIAGPAAGRSLVLVPIALVSWGEWRALHPATTVLGPLPSMMDSYKADPYGSYFGTPKLRFPVDPMPPADGPAPKTAIVAFRARPGPAASSAWNAASVPAAVERGGFSGAVDGAQVRMVTLADPPTVRVTTDPPGDVVYAFWFAWHAFHPTDSRLNLW